MTSDHPGQVATLPPGPDCIDGIRDLDESDVDCAGSFCGPCSGTLALNVNNASHYGGTTDYTHGWSFSPSVGMQVSHLGIHDPPRSTTRRSPSASM